MIVEKRRNRLLELVRSGRFTSLIDLAKALDVSESTVRRDVEYLETQGYARRIHGGVLYTGISPMMPHFDLKQTTHWEQKKAIALKAAELIEDGDTILLDGGSTTYGVGEVLVGKPIHVVTTSLPVANLFASDVNGDLVLVGGNICPRTGVARGPYAVKMLSSIRVRKTILSTAGINEEGFFNNNLLIVEAEQQMMKAGDEVIVVADSSKFGRQSLSHLCLLSDVDHIVVDDGISMEWREKIIAAGVNLHIAPMSSVITADYGNYN